jgi:hypothetical protein
MNVDGDLSAIVSGELLPHLLNNGRRFQRVWVDHSLDDFREKAYQNAALRGIAIASPARGPQMVAGETLRRRT